jgi:hypothetical protein
MSARFFNSMGCLDDLAAALYRTRTGNNEDFVISNHVVSNRKPGAGRIEVLAGQLEWFHYWHAAFNTWHTLELVAVQWPAVSDNADDGPFIPLRQMNLATGIFDAGNDGRYITHLGLALHYDNHHLLSLFLDQPVGS